MNRGIDHLVLCVHDLEAARRFYAALGFQLTPVAQHPFGTANSLVQLQGSFLELLCIAEPSKIASPEPGHFSFARHNQSFLEHGEGMSMLVFEGNDARADQAEFTLKKLQTYAPFDFSRMARLPGGEEVKVGFSLAFVTHPDMPRAAFFTCQQHAPQHFWKPDYQTHPNTARVVLSVTMVARDPASYTDFFQALQGTGSVTQTASGLTVKTARGDVRVVSPDAYGEMYGPANIPDLDAGPCFASFAVGVEDMSAAAKCVAASGLPAEVADGAIRIEPHQAFGSLVELREIQTGTTT